jgi:hypothetical protein
MTLIPEKTKIVLEEGFGRVYMISSNLTYVVIIFLKLKMY